MTLCICKLFLNAYERMCSSLKSVKIATSAVDVRRRTRLISYPDFRRPSGRETSYFKWRHGDCSDGNRLQLEQWPFCHIVTCSLAVIGTVTVVRIFLENDKVLAA